MTPPVALINMPFAAADWPSIGLGLLKAHLFRARISALTYNFNVTFARRLGLPMYREIAMSSPDTLAGEWAFSQALWGPSDEIDRQFFEQLHATRASRYGVPDTESPTREVLLRARDAVEPFLQECLETVPWGELKVVGFTTVFQQQMASLALAQRLKQRHPGLHVVFGGGNCEGPMGAALLRAFPFIDVVFSGESDQTFPEYMTRLLGGQPVGRQRGVLRREEAASEPQGSGETAPAIEDMDALPLPDYDEYFDEMQASDASEFRPQIVFETSRGCWWGAKSHCTFCGLNGETIGFRHKSVDRAIAEIQRLIDRYGRFTRKLQAVDNIIPVAFLTTFLTRMQELDLGVEIFYETKANLRKEHIAAYRAAGVHNIQPGIESLSTPVLKRMRKGVTRLQNVQLLKWCWQFGVKPHWNYIFGFPGERSDDYEGQAALLESLVHLCPPNAWGEVRFDRFSPYLTEPEALGVRGLRPYPAYRLIYRGLDDATIHDLAYYFEGEFDGQDDVRGYVGPLVAVLRDWLENASDYALFTMSVRDRTLVFDLRPCAVETVTSLDGARRAVLEACEAIISRKALLESLDIDEETLQNALSWLIERRFLLAEDERYLSVTIPLGFHYSPSGKARDLLLSSLRSSATATVPGSP